MLQKTLKLVLEQEFISEYLLFFRKPVYHVLIIRIKEFTMHLFLEKLVVWGRGGRFVCLFFSVILKKNWNIILPPKTLFFRGGGNDSISIKTRFYTCKNRAAIENVISNPILNGKLQLTVKMNVFHSSFLRPSLPKQQLGQFRWKKVCPLRTGTLCIVSSISGFLKTVIKWLAQD